MKILEVSDFHFRGGATITAFRISDALNPQGHVLTHNSSDYPTPRPA